MVPIQETISKYGASQVALETGLPLTTICRWRDENRIPGKGPSHRWRVDQFEAAVAKLRAEQRPSRKRNAA